MHELVEAKREVRRSSARAGYYTMFCPENLGGGGLGSETFFLVMEALYQRYGAGSDLVYDMISHWASGPSGLWDHVSPRLAADIRPRVFSGELLGCFGMSEPEAGSDAWGMKSSAVRDGDGWIINGSKQWTSFAPWADYCMVMAVTDSESAARHRGGISCFYVPTSAPGFTVESVIGMHGELGGSEAILSGRPANRGRRPGWRGGARLRPRNVERQQRPLVQHRAGGGSGALGVREGACLLAEPIDLR